jgi:PTH1 family peptidyl-tRNA hydrolase
MKFLIIGLGNIGSEYEFTRHNIGFDIADVLVMKYGGSFVLEKHAYKAQIRIKNKILVVIKPTTYMNLSGKAFKYWIDKEDISIDQSLTLVDEIALPLDTIRIKGSGSDGGHNGLKDIAATLGHTNYPKLRFGIGNEFSKGNQVNFVLGKWQVDELPIVKKKIMFSVEMIEKFVLEGIGKAQTISNGTKITGE